VQSPYKSEGLFYFVQRFIALRRSYEHSLQCELQILKELHKSCQREDGTDDQKKGTQLLEVYAIEIQMYTETKNNKKLKVRPTEFYIRGAPLF
jgi:hypothetical protein